MKKLLIFTMSVCLMLGVSLSASAAIHNGDGDFKAWKLEGIETMFRMYGQFATDTWYEVEEKRPNVRAMAAFDKDTFLGNLDYTVNDQTFLSLAYFDKAEYTSFSGSYLFKSGFFAGIEYIDQMGGIVVLSPGYRFSIGEESYLALSFDYASVDDFDFEEIIAYDLDYKYIFDGGRFYAQYYSMTDKWMDEDIIDLGVRYSVNDTLVVGLDVSLFDSEEWYSTGLTWNADKWIVDFQLSDAMKDELVTRLGGLYKVSDAWGVGAEAYIPEDSDEEYLVKFKYTTDVNTFNFAYATDSEIFFINYKWQL